MTETTSPALRTALAYYHAWTGHDLDKAMSYIAPDIVCDVPAGRLEGAGAYRAFIGPFVQIPIPPSPPPPNPTIPTRPTSRDHEDF